MRGSIPDDGDGLTDKELEDLETLSEKDEDELSDSEVTSKIRLSVKRRYDFPTWIVVFEFENRDGRRADCLAFNCKAGRNFSLVGFEFKASRSDWLAEKRDHEKSDLFVQLCDEWYVVAGRRGIVKEKELPDGWGLLELKPSGQLWNLVESDLNDLQNKTLDRRFYTRFMRKAIGDESNFTHEDIKEAKARGYQEAKDKMVDDHLDRQEKRMREKAESFDRLRDAGLGVYGEVSEDKIEQLQRGSELIRMIESDRFGSIENEIQRLIDNAEKRAAEIREKGEELQNGLHNIREEVTVENEKSSEPDPPDKNDAGNE